MTTPVVHLPTLVLDTETTGFDPRARVVSLGAVALDPSDAIVGSFFVIVQPDVWGPNTADAQRVHGLSPALITRTGVTPDDARGLIDAWWTAIYGDADFHVTAFNLSFDQRMLAQSGISTPAWPWGECIMRRAAKRWGSGGKISLENAMRAAGLGDRGGHNAMWDAVAAAAVLIELRREERP